MVYLRSLEMNWQQNLLGGQVFTLNGLSGNFTRGEGVKKGG